MEFRILGPLEVISDGQALDLGGAKQRALLAVLLLHPNQVVSRDRLIDALWEENPPNTAEKALQVHVSKLRKQLGRDRIVTKTPGYAIRVDQDELDIGRFERLVEEGGRQQAAPRPLRSGAGRPSPTSPKADSRRPEIGRLEELRLTVLEERIETELALGRHADLIAELEALVAEHPLRERLRAQLMLALYRSGRQAEALDVYQDARRALVEELGIEPGRELRELHQRDPPPRSRARADGRGGDGGRRHGAANDFVGRGPSSPSCRPGSVMRSPAGVELFLLQGEPGIGKSRLADELVSRAKPAAPTSCRSLLGGGRCAGVLAVDAVAAGVRARGRTGRRAPAARRLRSRSRADRSASCTSSFRVSPSPKRSTPKPRASASSTRRPRS